MPVDDKPLLILNEDGSVTVFFEKGKEFRLPPESVKKIREILSEPDDGQDYLDS